MVKKYQQNPDLAKMMILNKVIINQKTEKQQFTVKKPSFQLKKQIIKRLNIDLLFENINKTPI